MAYASKEARDKAVKSADGHVARLTESIPKLKEKLAHEEKELEVWTAELAHRKTAPVRE